MERYQEALNKAYEIISDLDFSSQLKCAEQFKILQEAVDKANKYDEKETPKKPDTYKRHKKLPINYFCPNCQKNLYSGQKHCDECGTQIDWKV